jgi:hypothetical protein
MCYVLVFSKLVLLSYFCIAGHLLVYTDTTLGLVSIFDLKILILHLVLFLFGLLVTVWSPRFYIPIGLYKVFGSVTCFGHWILPDLIYLWFWFVLHCLSTSSRTSSRDLIMDSKLIWICKSYIWIWQDPLFVKCADSEDYEDKKMKSWRLDFLGFFIFFLLACIRVLFMM